jgi:hypothetical protein
VRPAPSPAALSGRSWIVRAPLSEAWRQHGEKLRWLGVFYLAVAAIGKLHYALPHLLWQPEEWSALDVRYRYQEVAAWFAGDPVYGVVGSAVYPPATHAILWPLLGWMSIETARLLWAITIVVAGTALGFLLYRLAAPAPARDRLLVAGLVLACYPFQLSVMIGQLGVHVVALVVSGAFLLFRARPRWWIDVVVAAMLACSLVKPTISVPLVAVVLIVSKRARPVALVVLAYAALTLVAASAQPSDLVTLVRDWHQRAGVRVPFEFGVINLHLLLWWAGLGSWMTPVSLLVLTVASAWTWLRRDARPWILLGVGAILTRVWAHSTPFDDAFLLIPTIALFKIAFGPGSLSPARIGAGWLFAAAWAALLTPTWALFQFKPVAWAIHGIHAVFWTMVLVFLVGIVERDRVHLRENAPITKAT